VGSRRGLGHAAHHKVVPDNSQIQTIHAVHCIHAACRNSKQEAENAAREASEADFTIHADDFARLRTPPDSQRGGGRAPSRKTPDSATVKRAAKRDTPGPSTGLARPTAGGRKGRGAAGTILAMADLDVGSAALPSPLGRGKSLDMPSARSLPLQSNADSERGGAGSARRDVRAAGTRSSVGSSLLPQTAQGLRIGKVDTRDTAKGKGPPGTGAGLAAPGGVVARGRDRG
jgi:hypothetical protein